MSLACTHPTWNCSGEVLQPRRRILDQRRSGELPIGMAHCATRMVFKMKDEYCSRRSHLGPKLCSTAATGDACRTLESPPPPSLTFW